MKRWQKWTLAIPAVVLCVAASQFAMRGRHDPTGNVGYLGTDVAGVEAVAGSFQNVALRAVNPTSGLATTAILGGGAANGEDNVPAATAIAGLSAFGYGVYGRGYSHAIHGVTTGLGAEAIAVYGAGGFKGVYGEGYIGVEGLSPSGQYGVRGQGNTGVYGYGVIAGVFGSATSGPGVWGEGYTDRVGVKGKSTNSFGVQGETTEGTAIYGVLNAGGGGHAGYFEGRVHVNGTLTKNAGSFRIDHPLDPANKYLSHSFVESPDMKNLYDGVVTLDADGTATVELPEWFEALNKDFRYQLTCIGEHADVYIAEKIKDNRFRIAGGYAGMEVSWLVTGTRHDPYAVAYPIPVEELKSPAEAGRFQHPELYGLPLAQRVSPNAGSRQ